MENIICPICGVVNAVQELPWNEEGFSSHDICPCCGTHYGEDDWAETEEERKVLFIKLRQKWISKGMKWGWSIPNDITREELRGKPDERKPKNWNPLNQLKNIPKEFLGEDEKY